MAIGDTYRHAILAERIESRDDTVNVWHFRQKTANVLPNAMADLVLAWNLQCRNLYLGTFSALYGLQRSSVKQITGGLGVYEETQAGAGTSGPTNTGLPSTVAALISWKSGLAGRSKNGRTYLPPSNEEQLEYGFWTAAYLNGMLAFGNAMIGMALSPSILHAQWEFGVYSPLGGGFTPFTTFINRTVPATIRRRRIGSGS